MKWNKYITCFPCLGAMLISLHEAFIYLFISFHFIYIPPHSRSSLGGLQKLKTIDIKTNIQNFKTRKSLKTWIYILKQLFFNSCTSTSSTWKAVTQKRARISSLSSQSACHGIMGSSYRKPDFSWTSGKTSWLLEQYGIGSNDLGRSWALPH